MNHWCESCARKNLCYVVDDRPKCFVPITNTASGTPYLVGISLISRDGHEIANDEPQTDCDGCQHYADEYTADACYECKRSYKDCYVPQAERSE